MPGPWDDNKTGKMIVTTTPTVEGRMATEYLGLVTGESIMGANIFRDLFAGIRDIVGGRDQAVSEMIDEAKALGADAVIGVNFSYATVGASESMLMVAVNGTAVKLA